MNPKHIHELTTGDMERSVPAPTKLQGLKENSRGLGGGWLTLFVLGITVGTPVLNIALVVVFALTHPPIDVIINAAVTAALVAYSIVVGVRLWLKKPHAVRQVKIYLAVMFALDLVDLILGVTDVYTVRSLVWAVILFIYFSASQHVKDIYGVGKKTEAAPSEAGSSGHDGPDARMKSKG